MIRHQSGYWIHDGDLARLDAEVISEVVKGDCYKVKNIPPGNVFVDVGAHIGCVAHLYHLHCPQAKIVCVEAAAENIDVLTANVGHFATVIHAACTYDQDVRLLTSFVPNATATGGSRVVRSGYPVEAFHHSVALDERPLATITLEEIARRVGEPIEIVKLDCEGSEFSILRNSTEAQKAKYLFGEYHDQAEWDELRSDIYRHWTYRNPHRAGGLGVFHLLNPMAHAWDVVVGTVRDRDTGKVVFER